MAKNLIFDYTRTVPVPMPAGTDPGEPIKVGDFVGTAVVGVPPTNKGGVDGTVEAAAVDGVWLQPVTGAVTQVGSKVYIAADGSLSTTAGSNSFYGYALELKPAALSPIRVHVPGV